MIESKHISTHPKQYQEYKGVVHEKSELIATLIQENKRLKQENNALKQERKEASLEKLPKIVGELRRTNKVLEEKLQEVKEEGKHCTAAGYIDQLNEMIEKHSDEFDETIDKILSPLGY